MSSDDEGFRQTYDYLAVSYLGINAFNQGVNEHARKGWELVNGCMAGTAHYAYLRRPVIASSARETADELER